MIDKDQTMVNEGPTSFARWQARTIEQFGYALNLILTLAVAALGYELTLLLEEKIARAEWQNWAFALSVLSLMLSVAAGLWCVVNRLRDFRITTQTARRRERGAADRELEALRSFTHSLGERTWLLFWWQIALFGLGILLLVVALGGTLARALIGSS